LLKQVPERLRKSVRENDIVPRLGDDEFIIVLEDSKKEGAAQTADRIIEEICKPYYLNGHEALVTISVGISLYPDDGIAALFVSG
jgi:diguanylate cyclase (GGDEF)-like protein